MLPNAPGSQLIDQTSTNVWFCEIWWLQVFMQNPSSSINNFLIIWIDMVWPNASMKWNCWESEEKRILRVIMIDGEMKGKFELSLSDVWCPKGIIWGRCFGSEPGIYMNTTFVQRSQTCQIYFVRVIPIGARKGTTGTLVLTSQLRSQMPESNMYSLIS